MGESTKTEEQQAPEGAEFYWTVNEESYSEGPFDSREAADEAACADAAEQEWSGTFWTAWKHDPTASDFSISADSVIDQLSIDAHNMAGDSAEGWPASYCSEDEATAELETKLNEVLHAWIDKHDPPSFWIVRGIKKHKVER